MSLKGLHIKGYTLRQKIGSGGMGEVYLAYHQEMDRKAAVKVLYDKKMAERFKNEAFIQSRIDHRNIAKLYEYGEIKNRPCIVMEYVNGYSLEEFVKSKPLLTSNQIDHLFLQICKAVKCLHRDSIQHRDLKPSNIKITSSGIVKLLDFGISKATYTPRLTKEGFVVGTTDFMAPEQFEGINSIPSDIWSLGILLYFLNTHELPFEEKSIVEQRNRIAKAIFKKPSILNKSVTANHQAIIQACITVNPSNRPTIDEVIKKISTNENVKSYKESQLSQKVKSNYKKLLLASAALILITMVIKSFSSNQTGNEIHPNSKTTIALDTIEVVVQNTNTVVLELKDNQVLNQPPFHVTKPKLETLKFTLVEGKHSKEITIPADFKAKRFICNMDY